MLLDFNRFKSLIRCRCCCVYATKLMRCPFNFTLLIVMFFFLGCKVEIVPPIPTYHLSIDSVLIETGTRSLDKDSNGFYLLDLLQTSDFQQTIRRITGRVLKDSLEPTSPPETVDWESSHFWYTGNDSSYVVRRIVNGLGQWVIVDTILLNVQPGLLVPTINPTSISGSGGRINTMFAPIYKMVGDTVIVTVKLWTPHDKVYGDTVRIILK